MSSAYLPLWPVVRDRLSGPTAIILGSPRAATDLVAAIGRADTVCWQMDRYQAARLAEELSASNLKARIEVTPDVWDLPATFDSVIFPSPAKGERELKLDLVEQAFHVLKPQGTLAVLSPIERDKVFQPYMKKVFGKVALDSSKNGTALWSIRDGERKRRRHEITISAKVQAGEYIEFTTRPGLFAYGRLDDGTRSMLDVLEVRQGEHLVELGCGCGVAGIIAALRSGPNARLTLADSNARAVAVAQINAGKHKLAHVESCLTADFSEMPAAEFDLVLANPPYFAHGTIAELFARTAQRLLKRGGRMYLVTRQVEEVAELIEELFIPPLILARRDYAVLVATKP
jgi:16S rRNA (guanine1207-N2)-methyltransferase